MNRQEHLLTILGEECAEVAQSVSKALRFGLKDEHPESRIRPGEGIIHEFNDILALMEMLKEEGMIDDVIIRGKVDAKKTRTEEYLKYSKEQGRLVEGNAGKYV